MGGKSTRQQELRRSKERVRLLAARLELTAKRDRKIGALVLGRLRRRPVSLVAVSAGLVTWLVIRRVFIGSRR